MYEKRGSERVGRGKRREAIAELLRVGVARLEQFSSPWLLRVIHGHTLHALDILGLRRDSRRSCRRKCMASY